MGSLINKIKIKIKEKQYKKYIEEHRENVRTAFSELTLKLDLDNELYIELFKRILEHDLTKYSEEEFDAYRKTFYPINQEEKDSAKEDFKKAWEHHWQNNDHHWEHRQNDTEFTEETELAILENVCDWLAMGYRPIEYYNKNKDKIQLPEKQIEFLEQILNKLEETEGDLRDYGTV